MRRVVEAASLAGVLALPLALLHNQPSLVLGSSSAPGIHDSVLIVDAVAGAFLAAIGAKVSAGPSPVGRRQFLSAWVASLLGGAVLGFAGSKALLFLDGHGFYSLWNILFTLLVAFSFASLGVFLFYGVPIILMTGLKCIETVRRPLLGMWVIGAALVGGILSAVVFFSVIDKTGVGAEGSGLFIILAWPYFSWGAGIGACYICGRPSLFRGRTSN